MYPDSEELMDQLQDRFPDYDFFFGVWGGRENSLSDRLGAWVFDEPVFDYHPSMDVKDMPRKSAAVRDKLLSNQKRWRVDIEKTSHSAKQILMHKYMLDMVPKEYDMIVRTRFDVLFSDKDEFSWIDMIEMSYRENRTYGFARRFRHQPNLFDPKGHDYWGWRLHDGYIMDLLLCHPRDLFDGERAVSLFEQKKLISGHAGWWQVLSEKHGDSHQNYACNIGITSRGDK